MYYSCERRAKSHSFPHEQRLFTSSTMTSRCARSSTVFCALSISHPRPWVAYRRALVDKAPRAKAKTDIDFPVVTVRKAA